MPGLWIETGLKARRIRLRRPGPAGRLQAVESKHDDAGSLPDPLFKAADELARQRGVSRSELIAEVLSAYLTGQDDHQVTERLNALYREEDSTLDPVLAALQSASLPRGEW